MPESELTQSIAEAMPHIVWVHDDAGRILFMNRWWFEYTGESDSSAEQHVHPDDLGEITRLFRTQDLPEGHVVSGHYRIRDKHGVYQWHEARVVPFRRADGVVTAWLGSAINVHEQHELAEQRRYLLEASRVLGTSLDIDRTLADVARLVVPHIADWCAIDLLNDAGALHRAAVAHIDPAKVQLGWKLFEQHPPRPSDPTGPYVVMRTQQPEVTREIPDELLVASLPDPELLATFRSLGLRSAMVVPLVSRDRSIGTLSLVSAESGRLFEDRDVAFAVMLSARIAVAVDNARLYTEATRAREAAEAIASEVMEQTRAAESALIEMRRQRDDARKMKP